MVEAPPSTRLPCPWCGRRRTRFECRRHGIQCTLPVGGYPGIAIDELATQERGAHRWMREVLAQSESPIANAFRVRPPAELLSSVPRKFSRSRVWHSVPIGQHGRKGVLDGVDRLPACVSPNLARVSEDDLFIGGAHEM